MLTALSGTFMTASRMDGFSYADSGVLTGSALARAFRRLFGIS